MTKNTLNTKIFHLMFNLMLNTLNILCDGKLRIGDFNISCIVGKGGMTKSLTLREERRLTVFEKRVLRRILGPKRDGVTGEWRELHNEELNDLYCSDIIPVIGRMRWTGHVALVGERRGVYRILVRKDERKRPLGRPWRRWEDNIKVDLQEVG